MACGSRSVRRHDELVRIELAHGGALDERHALEALAHVAGIEEGQRDLGRQAGRREDFGLAQLGDARDGDPLEPEAHRPCDRMMRLAVRAVELLEVPAFGEADEGREDEEGQGQPGAEEARKPPSERDGDGPPAPGPAEEKRSGRRRGVRRARNRDAGRRGRHRLQEASSTIHRTSSPNE